MTKLNILPFWLMAAATFLVVVGDAAGRMLSDVGYSPFYVAWTRFVVASVILLPFSGLKRSELPYLLDWRVILRAALIAAAICSILSAIKTEPMANAFGGFFISPIVSYGLSALILREKISWPRSILLGISFIGVLIVVRPGFGMTVGMGFALAAGLFHGTYLMTTKWLIADYRPRFLLISQLLVGSVILLPFSTFTPPPITWSAGGFILLSAMASAFGNLTMVLANRIIPASVVAPLIYLQLLAAAVVGFVAFSEVPDVTTFAGLAIILTSGLSSLWFAGRGR